MKTLEQLRKEIDSIDDQLLENLAKRRKVVEEIGVYKKTHGLPIVDKTREEEKLTVLTKKGSILGLPQKLITTLWKILYNDAYTAEN